MGHLGHALGPHALHHLRGDGVLRLHQAVAQRHGVAGGRVDVAGPPDVPVGQADLHRLVEEHFARADALFDRGAVDERLEGRAGLPARLLHVIELVLLEVAAADPGLDLAVGRVHGHEARLQPRLVLPQRLHQRGVRLQLLERLVVGLTCIASRLVLRRLAQEGDDQGLVGGGLPGLVGNRLQLVRLPGHGVDRQLLEPRIERGVHDQAVRKDVVAVAVAPVDQPAAQLLGEVRRLAGQVDLAFEIQAQRLVLESVEFGLREDVVPGHLAQHGVAALPRALGIEHRVVVAGALQHSDEGRAFQHVQFLRRLVEIGARGHFDAVGVVQERHRVEVGFQNLLLAVDPLDLQGGDRLLDLAGPCRGAADFLGVEIAGELLRQGRPAFALAAQGAQQGGYRALHVHSVMFVEAMVLGGDQRFDHMGRDVGEFDPLAVGPPEDRQFLAVGREHHRRPFVLDPGDVGDVRRQRNLRAHPPQCPGQHNRQQQGQQCRGEEDWVAANGAGPSARRRRRRGRAGGRSRFHGPNLGVRVLRCCRTAARATPDAVARLHSRWRFEGRLGRRSWLCGRVAVFPSSGARL